MEELQTIVAMPKEDFDAIKRTVKESEHVPVLNTLEVAYGKSKEMYFVPASYYTKLLNKLNSLLQNKGEQRK